MTLIACTSVMQKRDHASYQVARVFNGFEEDVSNAHDWIANFRIFRTFDSALRGSYLACVRTRGAVQGWARSLSCISWSGKSSDFRGVASTAEWDYSVSCGDRSRLLVSYWLCRAWRYYSLGDRHHPSSVLRCSFRGWSNMRIDLRFWKTRPTQPPYRKRGNAAGIIFDGIIHPHPLRKKFYAMHYLQILVSVVATVLVTLFGRDISKYAADAFCFPRCLYQVLGGVQLRSLMTLPRPVHHHPTGC